MTFLRIDSAFSGSGGGRQQLQLQWQEQEHRSTHCLREYEVRIGALESGSGSCSGSSKGSVRIRLSFSGRGGADVDAVKRILQGGRNGHTPSTPLAYERA